MDRPQRNRKVALARAAPYSIPPRRQSPTSTEESRSPSPPADTQGFAAAAAALPPLPAPAAAPRARRRRRSPQEISLYRHSKNVLKSLHMCTIPHLVEGEWEICRRILSAKDVTGARAHLSTHWEHYEGAEYVCKARSDKETGEECTKTFNTWAKLLKHFETHLMWEYICVVCDEGLSRLDSLKRHEGTKKHQKNLEELEVLDASSDSE
ncbi:hypothetical protein L226DRAFT_572883 [Lentinus tigrinus ALCF2SS1-7]|uniref:C2H2-type domain-containing protein n=1 Tax=Lentinus tigrinus ALCF2SS1-6 TaxID=1328759 RepID=A0A5C2S4U9_9APHY|nr:hypothetical protein L227DRAFT_612696 [Lentinus tigrinus ALCF2SS1-6]RPD72775.1 hypothetical protein L226DRAFT_572883 [Lentinus tigrinus ALCF2SS1-7]